MSTWQSSKLYGTEHVKTFEKKCEKCICIRLEIPWESFVNLPILYTPAGNANHQ